MTASNEVLPKLEDYTKYLAIFFTRFTVLNTKYLAILSSLDFL